MEHFVGAFINPLILSLFAAVGVLLGWGAYSLRSDSGEPGRSTGPGARAADMRLELLWTSIAAALLLGVYIWAHG